MSNKKVCSERLSSRKVLFWVTNTEGNAEGSPNELCNTDGNNLENIPIIIHGTMREYNDILSNILS